MSYLSLDYITPNLHKYGTLISFENWAQLRIIYKEILHINLCTHMSINIYNQNYEVLILSANPNIAHHLNKTGLLAYDGTLSSKYVKRDNQLFWWSETYSPEFAPYIKLNKEQKFGISDGVIITRKFLNCNIVYSFGFKTLTEDKKEKINNSKEDFMSMGNHCFSNIKQIAKKYISFKLPTTSELYAI